MKDISGKFCVNIDPDVRNKARFLAMEKKYKGGLSGFVREVIKDFIENPNKYKPNK